MSLLAQINITIVQTNKKKKKIVSLWFTALQTQGIAKVVRFLPVTCSSKQSHDNSQSVQEANGGVEDGNSDDNGQDLFDVGSDSHGESTGLLVGGERDVVEEEGNDTVDQQSQDQLCAHLSLAE